MITDSTPLREARDWLRQRAMTDGAPCPCCHQLTKVYRRRMTATTGRTMVEMHRRHGADWVHVPTLMRTHLPDIAGQGGYAVLAQHWNLIRESPDERADGGRVGWWRLTARGERFVIGALTVPKYAHLYDGHCLGHTGDPVGIRDVLGAKFNYDELMGRAS